MKLSPLTPKGAVPGNETQGTESLDQHFSRIEFAHAYQPIVDVESTSVVAYEVLLRGPNGEPPGSVFQQIEKDLILQFDQHSRQIAMTKAVALDPSVGLSVNFSPGALILEGGRYLDEVLDHALSVNLPPKNLIIEITEDEVVQDFEGLVRLMNRYRKRGLQFAIDDFGSGFAGLRMLAEIQPELIKLDMSLVRGISGDGPRQAIIRAVLDVCMDLGIEVIAEGVETPEEYFFLSQLGVSLFQGYLLAKPGFNCLPSFNCPSAE